MHIKEKVKEEETQKSEHKPKKFVRIIEQVNSHFDKIRLNWEMISRELAFYVNLLATFLAFLAYASINDILADFQGKLELYRFAKFMTLIIPITILLSIVIRAWNHIEHFFKLCISKMPFKSKKFFNNKTVAFFVFISIAIVLITYHGTHSTKYYHNIVEIYGIPVGIGESLGSQERESLVDYWKIKNYYLKGIIYAEYIAGNEPLELLEKYSTAYSMSFFKTPARIKYSYTKGKNQFRGSNEDVFLNARINGYRKANTISYYASNNKLLLKMNLKLNGDCSIDSYMAEDAPQLINSTLLGLPSGMSIEKSPVAQIYTTYNELGLVESRIVKNSNNAVAYNLFGVCGERYTYDREYRMISLCYLDVFGNPAPNSMGIVSIAFDYEENGNLRSVKYYSDSTMNGKTEGFNGAFYEKLSYSENNLESIEFLDRNETKFYDKYGISTYKYEYDSESKLSRELFLNSIGEPIMHQKYNSTFLTFTREPKGSLKIFEVGFDSKMLQSTRIGTEISEKKSVEFNNQNPMGSIPTFSEKEFTVSAVNGSTNYNAEDKSENLYDNNTMSDAERSVRNYSNIHYEIGKNDEIVSESYYDEQNIPIKNEYKISRCDYKYDVNGNISEKAYFDESGKSATHSDGYSVVRFNYDKVLKGNKRRISYLNAKKEPVFLTKLGYSAIKYEYKRVSSKYEEVTETYLNTEDLPCIILDGRYMALSKLYDENGRLVKKSYFLDDSVLTSHSKIGVAEILYEYSDAGNITREWYKNTTGNITCRLDVGFAIMKKEYNAFGQVVRERYFDSEERPIAYKNRGYTSVEYIYDNKWQVVQESYFDDEDKPILRKDTGYASIAFEYDNIGNVIKGEFFNTYGKPTIYKDRSYSSYVSIYDGLNRIEDRYFGINGALTIRSDTGYAIVKNFYDKNGRYEKSTYLDVKEKPIQFKGAGYSSIEFIYGDDEKISEKRYCNEKGELMLCYDTGVAIEKFSYDDYGNVTSTQYFGTDEKRILHKVRGYATCNSIYDNADWIEERYLGINGELVQHYEYGYAVVKNEYDSEGKGRRVKQSYFDIGENSISHRKLGCAESLMSYDEKGQLIEERYRDVSGNLMLSRDKGYAIAKYTYDNENNRVQESFFGTEGESILRSDRWYATVKVEYDGYGHTIKASYLDTKGNSVLIKDGGYASFTNAYKNGNWIESRYFGVDGMLTNHSEYGYAIVKNEYNSSGQRINQIYFGTDENLTMYKDEGYASIDLIRNDKGYISENRYYGLDGNLTLRLGDGYGYAIAKYELDDVDNVLGGWFYDKNENPALLTNRGYAAFRDTYENGNYVKSEFFDVASNLTLRTDTGYAVIKKEYNNKNRCIRESYLDTNENLTLHKNGYASIDYTYDERGNVTEYRYGSEYVGINLDFDLDADEYLVMRSGGYAIARYEYDDYGNTIKGEYLDTFENPTIHNDYGYASYSSKYEDNNWVESNYFGVSGKPILHAQYGYATVKNEYNQKNQRIWQAYFDLDGKPIPCKGQGFVAMGMSYDDRGNATDYRYYNDKNELMLRHDTGYAIYKCEYNGRGKLVHESFFDIHEKPIAYYDRGYASVTIAYDDKDNVTEYEYYNINEDPVIRADTGYAIQSFERDDCGRVIKEKYKDAYGDATNIKDGYYSAIVKKYDEKSNLIEIRYTNGNSDYLVTNYEYYCSIIKKEYDDRGRLVKERYYDIPDDDSDDDIPDDDPVKPASYKNLGYVSMSIEYDEKGNKIKYMYFDADEKLAVRSDTNYSIEKYGYDNIGNVIKGEFFKDEDKPIIHKEYGYHLYRKKYDERRRVVEAAYFGVDDNLVERLDTGYASILYEYYDYADENIDGRITATRERYLDAERKPTPHKGRGYSSYVDTFQNGNWIIGKYYDSNYELINRTDTGYAIIKLEYDAYGNVIKEEYLNKERTPVMHKKFGYASFIDTFKDDCWVEGRTFDENGKLIVVKEKGYAIIKREFDDRWQVMKVSYYNNNEKLMINEFLGYAVIEYEYDEMDNISSHRYLNEYEQETKGNEQEPWDEELEEDPWDEDELYENSNYPPQIEFF